MVTTLVEGEWQEVARGSSPEELQAATPSVANIENGQQFKFTVHFEWWAPIGPFFDLFLAESFVSSMLEAGGRITDVYSTGFHDIVVEGVGDTSQIVQQASAVTPLVPVLIPVATLIRVFALILVGILGIQLIIAFIKSGGEIISSISSILPMLIMVMIIAMMGRIMPGITGKSESKPKET